jgi:hypothetical protein
MFGEWPGQAGCSTGILAGFAGRRDEALPSNGGKRWQLRQKRGRLGTEMGREAARRAGSRWIVDGTRTAETVGRDGKRGGSRAGGALAPSGWPLAAQSDQCRPGAQTCRRLLVGRFRFGMDAASPMSAVGLALQLQHDGAIDHRSRKAMASGGSPRYSSQVSKSTLVTSAVLTGKRG